MSDTTFVQAGVLPTLRQLANQTRQSIEANWERQQAERAKAERRDAVEAARAHIRRCFSTTLARVLAEDAWIGYPAVEGEYWGVLRPCAVAWLGDGAWLHHTTVFGSRHDALTLWRPCGC